MIKKFKNFIQEEKLFGSKNTILLGVSGGIDSMVMAELFALSEYKFAIAHCNFGLRGQESNRDSEFVQNYAKKNKIRYHSQNFDTRTFAVENKLSVQVAARDLRMKWFNELLDQFGYDFCATAHHQDDQIETFFINLLRGTGLSGLHGILPKQGKLIHPMLFARRSEIEHFASKNKIDYREDSSNIKTDYTRNKIRHQLIPVIKEIKPDYQKIFTSNIYRFREAEKIYMQKIKSARNIIQREGESYKISIKKLLTFDTLITYLYEIISPFGFHYSVVPQILKSIKSQSGKKFYSKTHLLVRDRDYLLIECSGNPDGNKNFVIEKESVEINIPLHLKLCEFERASGFEIEKSSFIALFDADKVNFPLTIRQWKRGDSFYPLGMNHKKLLSDYFIDNKLSSPAKSKTWLLISDDQIIWIIGQRIDNRYKILPSTKRVLRIELIK